MNYPQNQIYCIVPVQNTLNFVVGDVKVARKSLDGKFYVWHYLKTDSILDKLKVYAEIKLLSHAEALKLMVTKEWLRRRLDFFSSLD